MTHVATSGGRARSPMCLMAPRFGAGEQMVNKSSQSGVACGGNLKVENLHLEVSIRRQYFPISPFKGRPGGYSLAVSIKAVKQRSPIVNL